MELPKSCVCELTSTSPFFTSLPSSTEIFQHRPAIGARTLSPSISDMAPWITLFGEEWYGLRSSSRNGALSRAFINCSTPSLMSFSNTSRDWASPSWLQQILPDHYWDLHSPNSRYRRFCQRVGIHPASRSHICTCIVHLCQQHLWVWRIDWGCTWFRISGVGGRVGWHMACRGRHHLGQGQVNQHCESRPVSYRLHSALSESLCCWVTRAQWIGSCLRIAVRLLRWRCRQRRWEARIPEYLS